MPGFCIFINQSVNRDQKYYGYTFTGMIGFMKPKQTKYPYIS